MTKSISGSMKKSKKINEEHKELTIKMIVD